MNTEPLDIVPLWLLLLSACFFGGLAIEGGYRFGIWRHAHATEEREVPVGAMVGAILGLLAFLLAFTFHLAASRYDARRQAVLDEANAIGTTYLRARLLPEAQREDNKNATGKDQRGAKTLLENYVDDRIHGVQKNKVKEAVEASERIQELLWVKAIEASKNKEASPVMTSLFIQALNNMIDLHAKRIFVGVHSRIPLAIWICLFALAFLSMLSVGYHSGLSATRRSPAMLGMVLAFAGVLFLIADLDRGTEGFLTTSQQAMLDLQKSMHAKI